MVGASGRNGAPLFVCPTHGVNGRNGAPALVLAGGKVSQRLDKGTQRATFWRPLT